MSRQDTEAFEQFDFLIRRAGDQAIMNYNGPFPEVETRADLYLIHMEEHPRAVQLMLFLDEEGAQLTWALARDAGRRERLEALLSEVGWRVNGIQLERTDSYRHGVQEVLDELAESANETIVSGSTKRETPGQVYIRPAEAEVDGTGSPVSQRSNGSPSVHGLSSVSGNPNGSQTNLIASFLSSSSGFAWVARRPSSPEESHRPTNRAVMEKLVCSTGGNLNKSDAPADLQLLSEKKNDTERPKDLDDSQVGLRGQDPAGPENKVKIHQNLQHVLQVANAKENQHPNWCTRFCGFLAGLFIRRA